MYNNPFLKTLEAYRNVPLFLATAPGNSGDTLLQQGLLTYLGEGGYTLIDNPANAGVIVIHGGGNIDDVWGVGVDLFTSLTSAHPETPVIVAPSTCHFSSTDFASVLNACTQNIHFFTRERLSLARLTDMRLKPHINVDVADDTAFLLEGSPFLADLKSRSTSEYTLAAFRSDRESLVVPFESHLYRGRKSDRLAYWISTQYIRRFIAREGMAAAGEVLVVDDVSYRPFDTFIARICGASRIITDRLHVAILGAMLEKPVHLYKTRYDKIPGVYDMTLRRYPNVIKMF